MDPNAALDEIRALVADALNAPDNGYSATVANHLLDEFAEKFDALDEWISGGAFLPDSWKGK